MTPLLAKPDPKAGAKTGAKSDATRARALAAVAQIAVSLVLAGVHGGCGVRLPFSTPAPAQARKLPPVGREARSEFEAGVRLMRLGAVDLRLAEARFKRAVQIDPNLWEAWYNLGLLQSQQKNYVDADKALQQALLIQPAAIDVTIALADVQGRLGRTSQAVALLRRAVAAKDEPALRKRLARTLRDSKRFGEAASEVRAILAKTPRDVDAYNLLALIYYDDRRFDMAELVLKKATAIDDKDAHSINNLGLVALAQGRDQEAFGYFERATTLAPRLVRARMNKAMVLLDCGDYMKAEGELLKAVEADPGSLEARIGLGVAYRGLKRFADAARSWEQVLTIDPRNASALYNLGVLYAEFQREPDRARGYLSRFLEATKEGHPKRIEASRRLRELKMATPKSKS